MENEKTLLQNVLSTTLKELQLTLDEVAQLSEKVGSQQDQSLASQKG